MQGADALYPLDFTLYCIDIIHLREGQKTCKALIYTMLRETFKDVHL